ncbi:MAG TPA: glycosyltransferase [Niabella sp.]|nr:glycosyltransferase [Niabella sp.]HQW13563.1 glycosyltransferase [Niabella sp.]HQX18957.1 glycosyltransferase [Niabella sp.]HQX40462.1 glycosyltransferase [Niabella sp.]HRB27251.1 glycosyltransferase [Niabella sp.]
MTAIILLLFVFYAVVLMYYLQGWSSMPEFRLEKSDKPEIKFSVIIPARNEEENIGRLLGSVQSQTYPSELYEVIVIDDHSEDSTAEIVKKFPVHLLQLKDDHINSYKKKAIEKGIEFSSNEWIVCTDADCIAHPEWLNTLSSFIQQRQPVFVAAPVCFIPSDPAQTNSLLHIFQSLDFLTLQGITGASVFRKAHSMCNGANLAYKRSVFYEVNGFEDIDKIASGDDMLLMHKIWKHSPAGIGYLKSASAIIETNDAPSWSAFFNQRIRWASKANSYEDKRIFAVLLLVYLFNLSFLVLLALAFYQIQFLYLLLILWLLKTGVEYPFIKSVSRFYHRQHLLKYFFFFQPMHIAYTIIAGLLGSFGKYEWKGRRVK